MQTWKIHTESGSRYEVHEVTAGEYVLTADHVPTATSADLRGLRLPMMQPVPWPAVEGQPLLLVIAMEDRIKLRLTSPVVRVEGPLPGGRS